MKPLIITAIALSAIAGAWLHGHHHGINSERIAWQGQQQKAVETAVQAEREAQRKADETNKAQVAALSSINDRLTVDLNRLRNRPERKQVSADARAECAGSTGAELSSQDAEFLVRESARADQCRQGLMSCVKQYNDVREVINGEK